MKKLIIIAISIFFCSCEEIVEVENISNEEVMLVAPSNDVIVTSESVNFTWEVIAEAEHYHLQIAEPDFESAIQITADTLVSGLSLIKNLNPGAYQWRVRAENSAYITNYSTNSFTVDY